LFLEAITLVISIQNVVIPSLGAAVTTQDNSPQEWRQTILAASVSCGEKRAGVCLTEWRKLVCGAMVVVLPASLIAQDFGRAMLHSDGGTWLNGKPAPNSSAIFPHDLVQTRPESSAKVDIDGSTVTIQSDTLVQFEEDEIFLDHGTLQENSARGMKVRVNCMTIVPLAQEWTRYEVIDTDGKVLVAAYENDVKIHIRHVASQRSKGARSSDVTVHRGEQVTRDERCGARATPAQMLDAKGAILNSPWAKGTGIVAIGVLTCWALCRDPGPVSPDKP
jgi:hypothetical protein